MIDGSEKNNNKKPLPNDSLVESPKLWGKDSILQSSPNPVFQEPADNIKDSHYDREAIKREVGAVDENGWIIAESPVKVKPEIRAENMGEAIKEATENNFPLAGKEELEVIEKVASSLEKKVESNPNRTKRTDLRTRVNELRREVIREAGESNIPPLQKAEIEERNKKQIAKNAQGQFIDNNSALRKWPKDEIQKFVNSPGKSVELGRGAFGAVLGYDEHEIDGAKVAAKFFNKDIKGLKEANNEFAIGQSISKAGRDNLEKEDNYLVEQQGLNSVVLPKTKLIFNNAILSEKVDGYNFFTAIKTRKGFYAKGRPASRNEAIGLAANLFLAMDSLHKTGHVHRDIKLENLMITEGKNPQLKIIDLGLVRKEGEKAPAKGNPLCMAPECLLSNTLNIIVSSKSDIWSLGVCTPPILFACKPEDLFDFMKGPISILNFNKAVKELKKAVNTFAQTPPEEKEKTLVGSLTAQNKRIGEMYTNKEINIFAEVCTKMLAQNPEDRPSADQCQEILQELCFRIPTDEDPRWGVEGSKLRQGTATIFPKSAQSHIGANPPVPGNTDSNK